MPGAESGHVRPMTPAVQAQIDQEDAAVTALVKGIVAHWEKCPATPRNVCMGGVVHALHDLAHEDACRMSNLVQAALAALAKVEWERTHGK